MPKRNVEIFTCVAPLAVCLALFHKGLFSWFVQDDFGSLLLARRTRTLEDALQWLVQPLGQGVMRPLPDAYFYIVLYKLGGLNAFPYRLFVFATQFANLLLLTAVARRLTGSPWSALGGTLVWTANVSLVVGMVWTSAYSQILCCFFLLAGFLLFLKYVETGEWKWWWAQSIVFLLGLGTLEVSVVYPFLLLAYCLLLAREHAWKMLPLAAVAAIYAAISVWMIPRAAAGPYAMHFDSGMVEALWHYWTLAIGVFIFSRDMALGSASLLALALFLTLGLLWALVKAEPRPRRTAILGLAWFLFALAPVLPLRDQRMDYYLTVPTIGLGLAVGALLESVPRWGTALWLAVYFVVSITFIPAGMNSWDERSQLARRMVMDARLARASHPDRVVLLAGVTDRPYYAAIYDQAFAAAGVTNIFLLPEGKIVTRPGFLPLDRYELRREAVADLLKQDRAEVYRVSIDGSLHNVTKAYEAAAPEPAAAPAWIDLGLPFTASTLGSGWHDNAGGIRWMGRRAELRMAAPEHPNSRLRIRAIAPPREYYAVRLTVTANGAVLGKVDIRDSKTTEHLFQLPESLVGKAEMTIGFETNRTFRAPPDVRELGAAFGIVEVVEPQPSR